MGKRQCILYKGQENIFDRVRDTPRAAPAAGGIDKYRCEYQICLLTNGSFRQLSTTPVFRGRKLVLNYTDGSPCDSGKERDESKEGSHKGSEKGSETTRRKSTIVSLLCDRDHLADPTAPKVTVAYVAASQDDCTYFFEARSAAACGGVSKEQQAVGPGGVFGLM